MKKPKAQGGFVIVYTGEGKGKTTAALGLAFRAAGWGHRSAIIQFIKGYKETGEWKIIENMDLIDIYQFGKDKKMMIGKPTKTHYQTAKKAFLLAKEIISKKQHQVLILDEINNAMFYNLVEVGEVIKLLKSRPEGLTIVLTGRGAPKEIIKIADLVTEMSELKHPFKSGVWAKKGIDF